MSRFTDYAQKMRNLQTPFNGGMQPNALRQKSPLFNTELAQSITPLATAPQSETTVTKPEDGN